MVLLEKCTENLNLKWYHSRRVPKIFDNNGTIPGECRKSATIMTVPFQRMMKISLPDKNSSIPDECKILETKMVPFQRMIKIATKNGTISEKYKISAAKILTFQKMIEID